MTKPRLALFVVLAMAGLAYWPGLSGPLVLDDHANLEPLLRWMHGEIGWQSIVFDNLAGRFGRSVSMATFLANAATTGDSVYWMKATNLVLHLAAGVAIYMLLSTWMRLRAFLPDTPPVLAKWIPCLATAIWLLHPMLVSTVLYVVQRMAMLAAFFMLLACISYLKGRIALTEGRKPSAWFLLAIAVPVFTLLATLSKENGVLAPALCALMEWIIFAPRPGLRRPWPARAFIGAALVVPATLALALTLIGAPAIVGGYSNRSFTLFERVLTQPRVLWDYVHALILPYGPRLGLYHDDFVISHSLLSPPTTLLAIAAWVLAIGGAWYYRRKAPAVALGLGFFLVAQALESTVFPVLMYFEHREYLPAVGIIWAMLGLAALAFRSMQRHMHNGRAIAASASAALVLALGLATAARASIWSNRQAILAQSLATHPDSRWLRMDLAAFAMARRPHDVGGAIEQTDYLMSMPDPLDRRFGAMLRLSIDCIEERAVTPPLIDQVFGGRPRAIEPDLLVGFESLASRIMKKPCTGFPPQAMADALGAMLERSGFSKRDRSVWRLHFAAARLYWAGDDAPAALKQAKLAYSSGSSSTAVPVMIAGLFLYMGDVEHASAMLDRIDPAIPESDRAGRMLIEQYRRDIASRHQMPTEAGEARK